MPLVIKEGDVLKQDADYLVHSVNCKGVWGSGIALEIKKLYPQAFLIYNGYCLRNQPSTLLGSCLIIKGNPNIACLFTSVGYGASKSKPDVILNATKSSLRSLLNQIPNSEAKVISPKFNAGRFGIPWDLTQEILLSKLDTYPKIDWSVYFL